MSFNGSGTFNINTSGQPVVAGTTITSAAFNALTADLATGLSTAICKDGQTTVTANIPFNSFKITNLGAGTLTADAARMSQLQSGASQVLTSLTGTDTLTATLLPTLTAYTTGAVYTFVAANTNTTAVTLNIDALGAKAVTRDGSTALVAGDIVAGTTYNVMYDGTRFQLLSRASFTNLLVSGNATLSGGTANGVAYLNGSKVLTTGSALVFDGTNLGIGTSSPSAKLEVKGLAGIQYWTTTAARGTGYNYQSWYDPTGRKGYMGYGGTTNDTFFIANEMNDGMLLQTNATTRINIAAAGNVTINAPSSGTALTVNGTASTYAVDISSTNTSINNRTLNVYNSAATGTTALTNQLVRLASNGSGADCTLQFTDSVATNGYIGMKSGALNFGANTTTTQMTLDTSGNLTVPAMYGTTVTTPRNVFIDSTGKMGGISSTRASKTNIADLDDVSWLYDLKPVTFNYRKRDEDGAYLDECEDETQFGLIAEDTELVAPDLCIYDAEGKVAGIHYDRMTAPLLKALQQQQAIINDLTQRLAVLEGKA